MSTPALTRAMAATAVRPLHESHAETTRNALAAALDVEEMARALYMRPSRDKDLPTWEDQSERIREYWREYARVIRASILGES